MGDSKEADGFFHMLSSNKIASDLKKAVTFPIQLCARIVTSAFPTNCSLSYVS